MWVLKKNVAIDVDFVVSWTLHKTVAIGVKDLERASVVVVVEAHFVLVIGCGLIVRPTKVRTVDLPRRV